MRGRIEALLRAAASLVLISIGLVALIVAILLLGSGHEEMAVAVIVNAVVWSLAFVQFRVWRRPGGVVTLQESAVLPRGCDTVWDLIVAPDKVPVLEPGWARCYRVPGTPVGVGEQRAYELANGRTVLFEIEEYEPARRLVINPVLPIPGQRATTTLEPVDGGCRYTLSIDTLRVEGAPVDRVGHERWRRAAQARIELLRNALETAASPTGQDEDHSPEEQPVGPVAAVPPRATFLQRLDRNLSGWEVATVLLLAFVGIALAGNGRPVLSAVTWVLLIPLTLAALLAFRMRRHPAHTATVEESITLPFTCEEVWSLIEPAENSPLLEPTVRIGFRVPETPAGIGERQAMILDNGGVVVFEVVEHTPARRAVVIPISPRPGSARTVTSLEPVDGGCTYTLGLELDLDAGQRMTRSQERQVRTSFVAGLERTREVLESSGPR